MHWRLPGERGDPGVETVNARAGDLLRAGEIAPADARVLLRFVLRATDARLAAHPERELTDAEVLRYRALVARRHAGEPVAYLTGEREFYSMAMKVTPAVLIPRPETELLVELTLERLPQGRAFQVLDLATGSGCVAVAVARARPAARVTATDISAAALALARDNAARHGAALEAIESDWFEALAGRRFDLITANPPYVAAGDRHLDEGDLRFEPRPALVAGPTGYECIEKILAQAPRHLAAGGWLLVEHGHEQAARCRALLERAGFREIFSARDLAGIERVSGGQV
jgi:release factor glutamine methyltransferase